MFRLDIVDIAMIIVSIILVILVAFQNSKDDLGSSLTGAGSDLFKNQKERGAEVYIVRATYILSALFIVLGTIIFFR